MFIVPKKMGFRFKVPVRVSAPGEKTDITYELKIQREQLPIANINVTTLYHLQGTTAEPRMIIF